MSEHQTTDLESPTPVSRRQLLRYLGAAVAGGLVANAFPKSNNDNSTLAPELGGEKSDMFEITAKEATEIKLRASELAKTAFRRDGYSGVRQSNNLVAELSNPTTRLRISLGFKYSPNNDVLDFGPEDLFEVGIRYATLDDGVGIGTGEVEQTQGTLPIISSGGSAKNTFSIGLSERSTKTAHGSFNQPDGPTPPMSTEYILEIVEMDVQSRGVDGEYLKPPTYTEVVDAALKQFEVSGD